VSVSTKSNLFTRDIDLFNKIATDTWFTIAVSITTMNEELSRFLEPFSSTPQERLDALKKVKENAPNVQVGVNLMPVIPYICDSIENMEEIVRKSKEVDIDFILFGGLTLRDSQKDFFIKKLKNSKYKNFIHPLLDLYSGNKNIWSDYYKKLNKKILDLHNRYEISIRTKRWIPDKVDYRKWNYKISELLLNKVYLDNLKTGKSNKTMMWAGLNLNNLEESILDVYKRGELSKLRNFKPEIIKYVKPYLDKTKELRQRKGLDKFL
jgi:DNA repair photolyase